MLKNKTKQLFKLKSFKNESLCPSLARDSVNAQIKFASKLFSSEGTVANSEHNLAVVKETHYHYFSCFLPSSQTNSDLWFHFFDWMTNQISKTMRIFHVNLSYDTLENLWCCLLWHLTLKPNVYHYYSEMWIKTAPNFIDSIVTVYFFSAGGRLLTGRISHFTVRLSN